MEEEIRPKSTGLPTSGLLRLQARAPNLLTWLGPTWSIICGVIASGGFAGRSSDWLQLALLTLLVDGGWGSLWAAIGATDWATPLSLWREWDRSAPTGRLPYTLADAPGGRLTHALGAFRAWWGEVLWPTCGSALLTILVALPTAALLAMLLGMELLLLSAAALAAMQLGAIWQGGRQEVAPGWDALIAVAAPWVAGHIAFGPSTLRSAGMATLFALAWGAGAGIRSRLGHGLTIGSQLLVVVSLVVFESPLGAGAVFLLLVPHMSLLPRVRPGHQPEWYIRQTRPWLMAAMLVAALSI